MWFGISCFMMNYEGITIDNIRAPQVDFIYVSLRQL